MVQIDSLNIITNATNWLNKLLAFPVSLVFCYSVPRFVRSCGRCLVFILAASAVVVVVGVEMQWTRE
jgi:hypothetical protein